MSERSLKTEIRSRGFWVLKPGSSHGLGTSCLLNRINLVTSTIRPVRKERGIIVKKGQ